MRALLHILGVGAAAVLAACSADTISADSTVSDTVPINSQVNAPVGQAIADGDLSLTQPKSQIISKPQSVDVVDFTQYSQDMASFTGLTIGQPRIRAIDVVRLLFAPEEGAKIIKTSSAIYPLEGGELMLLSADGLADDSVRAQEFYLIFEGPERGLKLADYGLRVKCWRGENIENWQTTLCP